MFSPHSTNVFKGQIQLRLKSVFFTSGSSYFTGFFYPIQNWTINAHCYLTIDHFKPSVNEIEHMDVKTFGRVNVLTVNNAITTLKGITLTVRSGAEVCCHGFILVIFTFSSKVRKRTKIRN